MKINPTSSPAVSFELDATQKGKIEQVASEFESFFMSQIFGAMMSNVPQSEFSGSGKEIEMFQSMFVDEIAKQGSKTNRGLGLAQMIIKEMSSNAASQTPRVGTEKIDETF